MTKPVRANGDIYMIEVVVAVLTIVFRWDKFTSGQELRDGCAALPEFVREHDYGELIVATSKVRIHGEKNNQWLQEEWIPWEIEAGIEYSVSVHSDSVISEMQMESSSTRPRTCPSPMSSKTMLTSR